MRVDSSTESSNEMKIYTYGMFSIDLGKIRNVVRAWEIPRKREERWVGGFRMYHSPTFRAEVSSLLKKLEGNSFFFAIE